jgi:hypothetical protein
VCVYVCMCVCPITEIGQVLVNPISSISNTRFSCVVGLQWNVAEVVHAAFYFGDLKIFHEVLRT